MSQLTNLAKSYTGSEQFKALRDRALTDTFECSYTSNKGRTSTKRFVVLAAGIAVHPRSGEVKEQVYVEVVWQMYTDGKGNGSGRSNPAEAGITLNVAQMADLKVVKLGSHTLIEGEYLFPQKDYRKMVVLNCNGLRPDAEARYADQDNWGYTPKPLLAYWDVVKSGLVSTANTDDDES